MRGWPDGTGGPREHRRILPPDASGAGSTQVGDDPLGQLLRGLGVLAGVDVAVHHHVRAPRLGGRGVVGAQVDEPVLEQSGRVGRQADLLFLDVGEPRVTTDHEARRNWSQSLLRVRPGRDLDH